MPRNIEVAVLAKAPVPGFAKTRLIPSIGAHAAAVLQERLTARAVSTAVAANVGPVTLWCAPDCAHPTFGDLATEFAVRLRAQPEGDLGARMLAAMQGGRSLVIGTDCPALTPEHLRETVQALPAHDVALVPADDGGYVLIGTNAAQPTLFHDMPWSTPQVLAHTRDRAQAAGLRVHEFAPLWDVDKEDDFARMEKEFPELAF
jgi:rSAM/selenodomain-associated transferase 1